MADKTKFKIRSLLPTDSQAVVDVINMSSMRTFGFPCAVVDAVGHVWFHRYVPFSSEKVVAVNEQDQVVGYSYFASGNNNIVAETSGAVHPDYCGLGIGSTLLEWAEEKAKGSAHDTPVDVKTVLQTSLYEKEHDAISLFKDHGYRPVREWVHLALEMDEEPFIPPI